MTLRLISNELDKIVANAETRVLLNCADKARRLREDLLMAAGQSGEERLISLGRAQACLGALGARFTEAVNIALTDRIGAAAGPKAAARLRLQASIDDLETAAPPAKPKRERALYDVVNGTIVHLSQGGAEVSREEAEAERRRWMERAETLPRRGKDFAGRLARKIADELRDVLAETAPPTIPEAAE